MMQKIILLAVMVLPFMAFSQEESKPWQLGFGIGPNVTQIDAVQDELGSSYGAALWLRKPLGKNRLLDFNYDYFNFSGSGQNYQGLSVAYGPSFKAWEKFDGFALLGLGMGEANKFPKAVNDKQHPYHIFGRVGVDRLLEKGNWQMGVFLDFLYVDLDNKAVRDAQLALPMLSLTYRPDDKPKETVVVAQAPPPPVDSDHDGVFDDKDECPDTPLGTKVNSIGCGEKVKVSKILRVEFQLNKDQVLPQYSVVVDEFAQFLIENQDLNVMIEGHTDDLGSRNYNIGLSRRRAQSVKAALLSRGVSAQRIQALGYGPDRPEYPNDTDAHRSGNRRVMTVLSSGH